MKRVIALYHHMYGYNDLMLSISAKYGIHYDETETESGNIMLFTIREELEDMRTFEYFRDVLCCIFETEPSDYFYDSSSTSRDVSIYTILLAFVDYVRGKSNERHYKEIIRRFNDEKNVDMIESIPVIHLLKNGKYSLTTTENYVYGYDVMERLAPEKLKNNTQVQTKTRDNNRAIYRNFNWDNLHESCCLYRSFYNGDNIFDTEQVFLIARNMCGAEKGKQHFLNIIKNQQTEYFYSNINWKEILTAIIKGNIPLGSCQQCDYCNCCQHADNMLSTAKPQRFEVRKIKKEKYVSLKEVSSDLQFAFERAVNAQDNSVYIIKAQTGAGKTEVYLQYMKQSDKPFLIAVPTHDLILIPKTLIDKIACRNFVRQGEHRKTGCGCPVDTSAKQKHRPNRQVRFCRLSRMFNAA